MVTVCGIDPGITGGIAFLTDDTPTLHVMPVLRVVDTAKVPETVRDRMNSVVCTRVLNGHVAARNEQHSAGTHTPS
jgi:hypothetical protein